MKVNYLKTLGAVFFVIIIGGYILLKAQGVYRYSDFKQPLANTYRSDEMVFLRTYYLMKENNDFYQSFYKASNERFPKLVLTPDVFTWRFPTVFYLWRLTAPSGFFILVLYWIIVAIFLFSSYLLVKKISDFKSAILSVILVLPYLAGNFVYKTSFLFIEWWASFFLISGLTLFLYKKVKLAWIFFGLALFSRELIIIPIIILFIYSLAQKMHRLFFASLISFFIIFYFIHSQLIFAHLHNSNFHNFFIFSRIHYFDKLSFQAMIAFSMQLYPLIKFKINYVFVLLFFIGFLLLLKSKKATRDDYYVYLVPSSFVAILPLITTSYYNDYWGILFMPLLIMLIAPIYLKLQKISSVIRSRLS